MLVRRISPAPAVHRFPRPRRRHRGPPGGARRACRRTTAARAGFADPGRTPPAAARAGRRWRRTMHWLPKRSAASPISSGSRQRRRVERDLVGPGAQQLPHVVHRAHAAAHGERHVDIRRRVRRDDVQHDLALLVGGGDVEEDQLVGALRRRRPGPPADRIAGVAQSTKRTPLTTRPSLTSRQGITRLASTAPVPRCGRPAAVTRRQGRSAPV